MIQNNSFDWRSFLKQYSRDLLVQLAAYKRLEDKNFASVPSEMIKNCWLGYAGATDEDISAVENRLGRTLPLSYKSFLKVTNGWLIFDDLLGGLCPIQEVEYYATKHQDLIDAWNEGVKMSGEAIPVSDEEYFVYGEEQDSAVFREEYLQSSVKIGGDENNGTILLNPEIVFADGEWEAWNLAAWYPGAYRYRSFLEMMIDGYDRICYPD